MSSSHNELRSVRGTHDLLPEAQAQHNMIIHEARKVSARFGFQEFSTPIFEFSNVFKRTLGEASDIVNKEMYTFLDRNGDEITLRPEGTAGIARAFISEGLSQRTPLKLFYQGPMFRYERPQKGRQRQFHQLGVELLGVASPLADAECIHLAREILLALEIGQEAILEINSIGDNESRAHYTQSLAQHLSSHKDRLSADSQRRLSQNPLRILDSKDEGDQQLLKSAPQIGEFYNPASLEFFETVLAVLRDLGVPVQVNPFLVRGLDYYTHCVFEFRTDKLGAQDAILSGGRYDQLIEQMGGPATPGIGWAAGIERLALLTPKKPHVEAPIAVIPVHGSVERQAFQLAQKLRSEGLTCEIAYSGNMSKRMKRAANQNSQLAIIVGPDELARGEVTIKSLADGQQTAVRLENLTQKLKSLQH